MEKNEINARIDAQLPINGLGLEWLKNFVKGDEQIRAYERIINNRRQLKRIRYANNTNPAAAIYGESQVWKSYLVDNLLWSRTNGNFKLFDDKGNCFDFLKEINPLGGGIESTSLVSRFTTKQIWKDPNYPIKAVMLSPVDIIITLCDAYYNDVKDHPSEKDNPRTINEEKIKQRIKKINSYCSSHTQSFIGEDDIYDIKDYFEKGYLERSHEYYQKLDDEHFLRLLSQKIDRIPVNDWVDIFSILWMDNQEVSDTFSKLISQFERMDFCQEVYIPMEAVLRVNGTLLSVDRIYEFFDIKEHKNGKKVEYAKIPDVKVLCGKKEVTVSKSVFCFLAAELVFKIDDNLAKEKDFLAKIDLLDFPGARGREKIEERIINKKDCCEMMLRGKVAYLFNKYTVQDLISNLLYCHDMAQSEIRATLSAHLKKWVNTAIGDTPEKRQQFIDDLKISPLFIISTKFNIDLIKEDTDSGSDPSSFEAREQAMNNRWMRRFESTLMTVIGENIENKWFSQWTKTETFKNIYLLRSYDRSSIRYAGIFTGYLKHNEKGELIINKNPDGTLVGETGFGEGYEDFLSKLKNSFKNNDFIKSHFKEPERAWDEAATINKDGSEYIIENLRIAAQNTYNSRQHKLERQVVELYNELFIVLRAFYHSDKADDMIVHAVKKAGKIDAELDVAIGKDQYFFGKMMQKFLVKESHIYNYYLERLRDIQMIEKADLTAYAAIRMSNPELSHLKSFDENLEILKKKYKETDSETMKNFYKEKGIDLQELFFGETNQIKSNSVILAEGLMDMWLSEILVLDRFKDLIRQGFSENSFTNLLDNIRVLYRQLDITKLIAKSIRKYVDRYDKIDEIQEMIADISAEIINNFINNMGFNHYSEDKLESIMKTDKENKLDLKFEHSFLTFKPMETEDITSLFETLDCLPDLLNQRPLNWESLKYVPNFSQFMKWKDMMKISFVAVCDIPTYDVMANNELGKIIKIQEEKYSVA